MVNKFIFVIISIFYNNWLFLKFYNLKFKNLEYNFNFLNETFENHDQLKKILYSKKNFLKKSYEKTSIDYHNFDWLNSAKKIGGTDVIKLCKNQIFNWSKKRYKIYTFVWEHAVLSKRLINLIYNFDFYAVSANENEKKKIKNIIVKHYLILFLQLKLRKNNFLYSIQSTKALLLFCLINKINCNKIIELINIQIKNQIDTNGMHKSINPCTHAEYINHLYEIKNMFLFFEIGNYKKIEDKIMEMISVLKNLFHKDNSIALFNGSNNSNVKKILEISNLYKDIKKKNFDYTSDGLAIYENKQFKIFFDITKPNDKLLNQNLHSGTLSFELSSLKEKIITNCGSVEKRIGKKPEFLRYSAAHSTLVLNNTNISELIEKKSYKRAPKKVLIKSENVDEYLIWDASHDGYTDNYKKIIKRKLFISKKNAEILGEDTIINHNINTKKVLYNIRFHLTPICSCLITNDKKSVLIKTALDQSLVFKCDNKLTLEDSICINDGKRIIKTKQIVISGYASSSKKIEKWSISKIQ